MSRDISLLHPTLQEKIKKMQAKFPKMGVSETYRTVVEQDALYAKGRTTTGPIVTYAKGRTYSSQHQWGIAFDFYYNDAKNLYPEAWVKEVAAYAKKIGLAWGGDWASFKDTPHLYLPDWGSTTAKLKSQYGTFAKFKATWGTVSAAEVSTPASSDTASVSSDLNVDGDWAKKTTTKLQKIYGTTQDGKVSNQYASFKAKCPGCGSGWDWKAKPGSSGSKLIKAVQKDLGVKEDGYMGPITVKALQKKLSVTQDGLLGPITVKALQTWANKQ